MEELGDAPELSLGNMLEEQNQQQKSGPLGRQVDNKADSSNHALAHHPKLIWLHDCDEGSIHDQLGCLQISNVNVILWLLQALLI